MLYSTRIKGMSQTCPVLKGFSIINLPCVISFLLSKNPQRTKRGRTGQKIRGSRPKKLKNSLKLPLQFPLLIRIKIRALERAMLPLLNQRWNIKRRLLLRSAQTMILYLCLPLLNAQMSMQRKTIRQMGSCRSSTKNKVKKNGNCI